MPFAHQRKWMLKPEGSSTIFYFQIVILKKDIFGFLVIYVVKVSQMVLVHH